jgi:3-dehydrotetronate 4-kinase
LWDEKKEKPMAPLLGCIADDFTGATDLAGILVKNGMRADVMLGVPSGTHTYGSEAVVVALKSRSAAKDDAVTSSLAALYWLRGAGCRQFFFKYCSTFDSTDNGNIGPVAEALMDSLGTCFTIACPAFPANGRVVFRGYLFVNDVLLHESGMQDHPLNPMRDSNLVRVLQRQSARKIGLIGFEAVRAGADSISAAIAASIRQGEDLCIVDAVSDLDLREIAVASQDLPLLTGGSGLAMGLPEAFRMQGLLESHDGPSPALPVNGLSAVLSGSCSPATQRQVAYMKRRAPAFQIDPLSSDSASEIAEQVMGWAAAHMPDGPVLIYATSDASAVKAVQAKLGVEQAGLHVERIFAEVSRQLLNRGVNRLIIAGGETSGAVLDALGVTGLRMGPEIDPGVSWATNLSGTPLALALKSGNFGSDDFFLKAWEQLR